MFSSIKNKADGTSITGSLDIGYDTYPPFRSNIIKNMTFLGYIKSIGQTTTNLLPSNLPNHQIDNQSPLLLFIRKT